MLVVVTRLINTLVLLLVFIALSPVLYAHDKSELTVAQMSQNDFDAKLLPIIRSISMHDYEKALILISTLSGNELSVSQQDKLNVLAAECYVNTDKLDNALAIADELRKSSNNYFVAYAKYIEGRVDFSRQMYGSAASKFRSAIAINNNDSNFYVWLAQASLASARVALSSPNVSKAQADTILADFKSTMEEVRSYLIKNNYSAQAYELSYVAYAQLGLEDEAIQNLVDFVTYSPSIENMKELYQVFYSRRDFLSDIAMLDSFSGSEFAKNNDFLYMQGRSFISYGLRVMDSALAEIEVAGIEGVPSQYTADAYMLWINEGLAKYQKIKAKGDVSARMSKQLLLEELSVYLTTRQIDKAVTLLHSNRNISADDAELARVLGVVSFYAGEQVQGLKYMDKAISIASEQNDKYSKVYLSYIYDSLSAYYGYHGDYQTAKDFSDKAVAMENKDDAIRLMYNRYFSLKKLAKGQNEAKKLRSQIIEQHASNNELSPDEQAMVLLMLADESIENKEYNKGIGYARYAQSLSPTVADSYYYVALGLYKKQDYKSAIKWVKRAEYYESADPQYIYLESLIYADMGNKVLSQDALKRVKAKAANFFKSL